MYGTQEKFDFTGEKPQNQQNSKQAKKIQIKKKSSKVWKQQLPDGGSQSTMNQQIIPQDNGNKSEVSSETNGPVGLNELAYPGLCSALQLAKEIQTVSAEAQNSGVLNLSQETEEILKRKASKKANVPFTKHIFKDLVDLQINDEDILSGRREPSRSKTFVKSSDPQFDLKEFYKPDFSSQFCVSVQGQKVEMESVQYYNGFDIVNKIDSMLN